MGRAPERVPEDDPLDPPADPREREVRVALHPRKVADIIQINSPGDARAVATEVLYVTPAGQPMRAYIHWYEEDKKPKVTVYDDWGLD